MLFKKLFKRRSALSLLLVAMLVTGLLTLNAPPCQAVEGTDSLLASTLLGGERSECINDLVIGPEGKVYVAGITSSPDFPKTVGSYVYDSKPIANNQHAFVAILDANLQSVIACTSFIGDPVAGSNTATAIALDDEGYVYITGYTSNTKGFPTTPGAYQEKFNGTASYDNFVTKFKPDLSGIVASTLIGGSGEEYSYDIALDSFKNIYIAGQAKRTSTDYPTDEDDPFKGKTNNMAIVSKFNNDLTELLASRVVETRTARVLTVDKDNNVFVAGQENSPRGLWVAKLGDDLREKAKKKVGLANENVGGIVADESGNVYVTGGTGSGYPVTDGAYQTNPIGNNAYITKLSNELEIISSTTFGSGGQQGKDLVLDLEGNVYVLVGSSSGTIPTTPGAYADQSKGDYELGIAKFDSDLSELIASTYFGGSGSEGSGGAAIALDDNNNIFIASATMSIDRALQQGNPITPLDFPLTDNAFQKEVPVRYTNIGGGTTGFISKFQAPPNWNTNVYTFALDEQVGPAAINPQEYSIDITVRNGTDLTLLAPQITISPGATIFPESGEAVDFSTSEDSPVVYTVTAENGNDQQEWKVTVCESGVPVLQQALITPEGDIKLVFDIAIAELPAGAVEQFTLTLNEEPVTINSIAKTENEREIVISLASNIGSGAAKLAYTKSEDDAVQVKSQFGKALESFENSSFLKEPPALQAVSGEKRVGQEVVLTFDNEAAWRNAISGITVNGQEITAQQHSITDDSITINAAVFTAAGDYSIKVLASGYGCSEVVQTMQDPQLLGIKAAEVTLKGDLMLVFDKQIVLPQKDGVAGQFTVKVNGSEISINSIGHYTDRVTLVLADKVQGGQTVTVGYTRDIADDSLNIKSVYGEVLENFTEQPVSNTLPSEELPEAPVLQHAEATSQGDISVTFNKAMADPVGTQGQFTVKVDGTDITVTAVSKTNTPEKIKLELETKISAGQKVTIAYVKSDDPDKQIKSLDGGIAEEFATEFGSSAKLKPPVLSSDTTDNLAGQAIDITFTDDVAWRAAITDITVDGNSIKGQYTISNGNININAGVFNEARNYSIAIKATGYNSAKVEQKMMQVISQDTVNVDQNNKNLAVTGTTPATTVTVPENVSDATINVMGLLNASSDGKVETNPLPALTIAANTSIGATPVEVEIPAGTTVSAPDGWDGTINVPTVRANNSVTVTPDTGKTATVKTVIEVGFGDVPLKFSQAVKLVIPGQAGKDVGYFRSGNFTPITHICAENSQAWADANLPAGGDGKIDDGQDLVIWTKHFTMFATYEQTTTSSGGGDGTGGGEGTGTSGSLKILSFNKANLSPSDTLLQFDFSNGMDKKVADNLNKIRVYEKTTGTEVKYSDYNYIKQGSGDDAVKLRRLELMFDNLKAGTTYVVELDAGIEANNGGTLGTKQYFEFTTTGTGAGAAVEQEIGKEGGTINEHGTRIEIPAAAFAHSIKVTVQIIADVSKLPMAEKSKLVSDVIEITKNKAGKFSKAVTITIAFDKSKIDTKKHDLRICYLNEKENKWIPLENIQVDLLAGKASGEVMHFSKFAVIATEKAEARIVKFSDIQGHWAQKTIEELVAAGAIGGYPDGTFKPEQRISRAEFASILVKAFNLEQRTGKGFDDTADHWARDSIATAAAYGIVNGYSDKAFGPDDPITREQMAVMIVKAVKLAEIQGGKTFADGDKVSDWARNAVATASENNIINGYPDNTFRPRNSTTRAEAVTVIVKAIKEAA